MKVTVIIPARDEESTVAAVVRECLGHADRVIVVDGHSSDDTRRIAEEAGAEVILDNGRGKGDGYKVGIQAAGKVGVIVFIDADGSHEPADIPALVEPISSGKAEMSVASRWKGGSEDIDASFSSMVRNIGGNLLTVIIAWRFGGSVTDALNGYRAIKADRAHELDLKADDFDVEHEMVMKALKAGWRLADVPSHEYARKGGRSKLATFRKFHKFFWRLFINLL